MPTWVSAVAVRRGVVRVIAQLTRPAFLPRGTAYEAVRVAALFCLQS